LYGLDDEWILGPPGVLGDQLVVKSFVTATLKTLAPICAAHQRALNIVDVGLLGLCTVDMPRLLRVDGQRVLVEQCGELLRREDHQA
jgi:hypothetical protein